MVAVAIGVGAAATLASSAISSSAASSAANTQAASAKSAQQLQASEFQTTQNNLQPYVNQGLNAQNTLNTELPSLTAKFNPTMSDLAKTPGYQFTLQQGLQGVQNSYAAQGLGSSGAALKGATNYAEGLAGTTYQQQFQNYLTQNQQIYGMLQGQQSLGENAAAGLGTAAQNNANSQSSLITSAGASTAAGTVGSANATSSGLTGLSNNALNYALLNNGSGTSSTSGLAGSGLALSGSSGLGSAASTDSVTIV